MPDSVQKQTGSPVTFLFLLAVFLVAMVVAHLTAQWSADVDRARVVHSIIVAAFFAVPALCLYALRPKSRLGVAWWLYLWTFAYVAFMTHLYWAFFGVFQGDFKRMFHDPSVDTPYLSLGVTAWWTFDVVVAWVFRSLEPTPTWIRVERALVHVYLFAMLYGATAVKGTGSLVVLSHLMVIAVPICFVVGVVWTRPALMRFLAVIYGVINRFVPWHRLPAFFAAVNLLPYREVLRRKNLFDTEKLIPHSGQPAVQAPPYDPSVLGGRTPDGSYNDLSNPTTGMAGTRFGRNVPMELARPDTMPVLLDPSPREVSRRLMTRTEFKPATIVNLMAAAWIQFMTHDWFHHNRSRDKSLVHQIPLQNGDDWAENPMRFRKNEPDPTRNPNDPNDSKYPPTFLNPGSQWWDASQIYGSDALTEKRLREHQGGKLRTTSTNLPSGRQHGLSDDPATDVELAGFADNWWIGLTLLHTLFTLEHNAICARLQMEYPDWDDDHLFRVARLINVALMAKIHTVEWTPAILPHPAIKIALGTNWWGVLGERIHKAFGRVSADEALSGIPGSAVDNSGINFAFTEEFVSVYRLHPLMPDKFTLFHVSDGREVKQFDFGTVNEDEKLIGSKARTVALQYGSLPDFYYSFGIAYPGAISLHNYPNFLRRLERKLEDGTLETIDLATVDVMRDRERGVPRYNQFRELLHLPRLHSIDELNFAEEIKAVYGKDGIDRVDLQVGLFAEKFPTGFGFSDTAFRVFILMASRRLNCDRFFTTDYRPEVYTQTGLDWIDANTMRTVLIRHFPELEPALRGSQNAFRPWRTLSLADQEKVGAPAAAQA